MLEDIWNYNKPYIIAEVAQNHDGSLGLAHAFIDAVAETGADAVKFQTHYAEEESSKYEPFRVNFSYEDETRFDYWKRMEFTDVQWEELFSHATEKGLDFLSSPFSKRALNLLNRIGVQGWKFGAGEVFNDELLDMAISTGKPIILSTGLSTYSDIDSRIEKIKRAGNKCVLMYCVTAYPSLPEMIDIEMIEVLRGKYGVTIGLSDHSATIYPALSAVTLGAKVVEVHVTMDKRMFGPDVKASVNMEQLHEIVEGAKFISVMRNTHTDMNRRSESQDELKALFSKSLFSKEDIRENEILSHNNIISLKPCLGICSNDIDLVVGRRSKKNIKKGEPIFWDDIF